LRRQGPADVDYWPRYIRRLKALGAQGDMAHLCGSRIEQIICEATNKTACRANMLKRLLLFARQRPQMATFQHIHVALNTAQRRPQIMHHHWKQ
jgi:hypothetical protein